MILHMLTNKGGKEHLENTLTEDEDEGRHEGVSPIDDEALDQI